MFTGGQTVTAERFGNRLGEAVGGAIGLALCLFALVQAQTADDDAQVGRELALAAPGAQCTMVVFPQASDGHLQNLLRGFGVEAEAPSCQAEDQTAKTGYEFPFRGLFSVDHSADQLALAVHRRMLAAGTGGGSYGRFEDHSAVSPLSNPSTKIEAPKAEA